MPRSLQACGPCKRRKVRCNGERVCQQCTHLGLRCQYSEVDPAARTRRRIARGVVINEHRGPSSAAPRRVKPQLATTELSPPSSKPLPIEHNLIFDNEYFLTLLSDYSNCVFPFLPVISGARFRSLVSKAEFNKEDGALVHALAAVTINMTRVRPQHRNNEPDQIQRLYTRALELRGAMMPESSITVENTMIPLLVSICLFANRSNIKMGFYFLREAITRLQLLEDSEMPSRGKLTEETTAQLERLHWLLFIHERFVSITYNRNVVLPALRTRPAHGPMMEDLVTEGFNHITALFGVIDAVFIEHWLDRQSSSLTIAWIDRKQLEIGLDIDVWESEIRHLTEMQQVDLIVTRYWLHMLLWQMALSKFLLSSSTEEDFRSIMFPIRLSRRLRSILVVIQPEAVQIHGTGIVQKIFEITNTIADIIIHVPTASIIGESPKDHLDNFLFLYRFLLRMSEFHPVEEAVLKEKLHTIESKTPCKLLDRCLVLAWVRHQYKDRSAGDCVHIGELEDQYLADPPVPHAVHHRHVSRRYDRQGHDASVYVEPIAASRVKGDEAEQEHMIGVGADDATNERLKDPIMFLVLQFCADGFDRSGGPDHRHYSVAHDCVECHRWAGEVLRWNDYEIIGVSICGSFIVVGAASVLCYKPWWRRVEERGRVRDQMNSINPDLPGNEDGDMVVVECDVQVLSNGWEERERRDAG